MTLRTIVLSGSIPFVLALTLGGCVTPTAEIPLDASPPTHPLIVSADRAFLDGNFPEALRRYRAYREGFGPSPYEADCHLQEGLCLLRMGDAEAAEDSFRTCIDSPRTLPIEARAHVGLGDAYYQMGRFVEAIDQYDAAVNLRVDSVPNDYALYRIGCARICLGRWDEGRSFLQEVCRRYPESPVRPLAEEKLAFPEQAFYVRTGTFTDSHEAGVACERLIDAMLPARVVERETATGRTYEVWVGRYDTWLAAREVLVQLATHDMPEARVIP